MKQPDFWRHSNQHPGWQAHLLRPVSWLITQASKRRARRDAEFIADIPVICVGNINIGGSGKTPTAIAIAQRLLSRGFEPHFVSRGYGGQLHGPVRVDEQSHNAADVGDEPLLLAAFAPTWISKDRAAGVAAAQKAGAHAIILDDGYQNPSVGKDISIVVVDAGVGFGNGLVFPAGPLRERISDGLKRADVMLTIGPDRAQKQFNETWPQLVDVPKVRGELVPLETGMDWRGLRVMAFAGIGHPEKFFETLKNLGANLVGAQTLDDHQPYSPAMISRLGQQAQRLDAQLVTTEKDAARLPAEFLSQVLSLVVRLEIEDWSQIDALLHANGLDQPK